MSWHLQVKKCSFTVHSYFKQTHLANSDNLSQVQPLAFVFHFLKPIGYPVSRLSSRNSQLLMHLSERLKLRQLSIYIVRAVWLVVDIWTSRTLSRGRKTGQATGHWPGFTPFMFYTEKVQRKLDNWIFFCFLFNPNNCIIILYVLMLSQKHMEGLFVIFLFHLLGPVEVCLDWWHDTM